MPHRDQAGLIQHVVFGLADALPKTFKHLDRSDQRLAWADSELDRGYGSKLLASDACAQIVEDCLLQEHGERYALAAWCVMPTHVHVLVEQFDGQALASVIQTWKSATAHKINKLLTRRGSVWAREYFDRFMRTEEQYAATIAYIESNPVAAGLIDLPERWRFSSAWSGRNAGGGAGGPRPPPAL